ncbi:hypothetical protein [Parafilimonas sp.]|uniref:hypothetical protein n=1 Tax=Parafilimonas sp. TaxID=1969739 RepID=UPI0039E6FE9F
MKNFAYNLQQHTGVIHKTRSENWYKEEMFVRFLVLGVKGLEKSIAAKMLTLPSTYEEA